MSVSGALFDMVKLLDVGKNVISKYSSEKVYEDEINEERCITIAFVGDERICDGYYYATSFKLLCKYLKKPEILEEHAEVKHDIK